MADKLASFFDSAEVAGVAGDNSAWEQFEEADKTYDFELGLAVDSIEARDVNKLVEYLVEENYSL